MSRGATDGEKIQGIEVAAAAHVHLWGYEPTAAHLEVTPFPVSRRIGRALKPLVLIFAVGAVLLVATLGTDLFVTPLIFAIGVFVAYRAWRGECEVRRFAGCCPRCSAPLTIDPGSNIRLPHRLDCYSCHATPVLADKPHAAARECAPAPP